MQGFSDEGYAVDYETKDNGNFLIKEAILSKVSLVDLPAEATAKLRLGMQLILTDLILITKRTKRWQTLKCHF